MQEGTSLYIHIPYCASKCFYCDFFSMAAPFVPEQYIDCLLKEAEFYANFYDISHWKTVYIGGGSPSLLSPLQIKKLLTGLASIAGKAFLVAQEVTIEMNPESLSKEKLISAQENGVTRLSLGVQSLNENALAAVGRHCKSKDTFTSIDLIKSLWNGSLSLDVIAGLPSQHAGDFLKSLKQIIDFNGEHISLYTLTIEEKTPLCRLINQNKIAWDYDEADRQWILGRDLLEESGYEQYEVSNFSKKDFFSRHNMTYWQQEDYIGIGLAAAGSIYKKPALRWTNTHNINKYINFWSKNKGKIQSHEIPRTVETLSEETLEYEFLMLGLRTLRGLDEKKYKKLYSNLKWKGDLKKRLESSQVWLDFINQGKTRGFSLTKEGLLFLNTLLVDLA